MLCVLDYRAVGGWKRAEPAPLDMAKTPSSRPLVGATGRNNWFSKSVPPQIENWNFVNFFEISEIHEF